MSGIVELRQYTLRPAQREVLIGLFERKSIERQEDHGMDIVGTFRDTGDADRFVRLRGFPDKGARAKSLAAFYGGPVWKRHRDAANGTIIDSDNVLLLKPAWEGAGFPGDGTCALDGTDASPAECLLAVIHFFDGPVSGRFIDAFRETMPARYRVAGAEISACFLAEASPNSFPALPARAGENVLIWFAMFANADRARLLPSELNRHLSRPVQTLGLLPTARARLRLNPRAVQRC